MNALDSARIGKQTIRVLLGCALLSCLTAAHAQDKPNIVLVFMDNFGWGEPGFNGGGIIRGAPTPRLDKLASEGLRLTNFNVEAQCTPSRSAIMTGRYAIRSGNGTACCPLIRPTDISSRRVTRKSIYAEARW